MKHLFSKMMLGASVALAFLLQSCGGGTKYLVVPHSVSTASSVSVNDLGLEKGQYDVLNSITETASVICEYKGSEIKITSGDGDFQYVFVLGKEGWTLKKCSGAASLGYFSSDYQSKETSVPNGEEFARRVAMARIIRAAKDYQADGVVEPVVISHVSNLGGNKIEISSTVTAKLIVIKSTN